MRASLNFTLPAQEREFQAALHGLRNGTLSTCETVQLRAEIERLQSRVRFCERVISSGDVATLTDADREAVEWYAAWVREVVPLYRSPTLTDEERRDIKIAADAYAYADHDPDCERIAATLRGLLERLK